MKSVGVITSNYLALCQHEERLVELAHDSVERPGAYEQLIQYFAEFNQSCSVPVSLEMKANSVGSMYDLFKSQGLSAQSLLICSLTMFFIFIHLNSFIFIAVLRSVKRSG